MHFAKRQRDKADGQNDKDRDKREDTKRTRNKNQINALECVQCNLYLLASCGIEKGREKKVYKKHTRLKCIVCMISVCLYLVFK